MNEPFYFHDSARDESLCWTRTKYSCASDNQSFELRNEDQFKEHIFIKKEYDYLILYKYYISKKRP